MVVKETPNLAEKLRSLSRENKGAPRSHAKVLTIKTAALAGYSGILLKEITEDRITEFLSEGFRVERPSDDQKYFIVSWDGNDDLHNPYAEEDEKENAKLKNRMKNTFKQGKNTMTKEIKWIALGVSALFGALLLLGSFSLVGPGERGVLITLGKTSTTVLGEGPHLKWPLISSIKTMSIRVKKSEDSTEAATKDMQKVNAKIAINWTINPESVGQMLREVGSEESIENNIIAPAVSEVLKAASAKMTAEEVLTRRMELKQLIDDSLILRLKQYGLIVKDISLVDLDFTNEFNHAVEQKQIAEQQAKQASYVAEKATQDAVAAVNQAKGEADSLLLNATAQAKAQTLLKQSLNKDVLTLEYLKKWNGQLPQVLTGSGQGIMLNINNKEPTK